MRRSLIKIIIAVLVVGSIGLNVYLWMSKDKDPGISAEEDVAQTVAEISKFMVLPDESPSLATITDLAPLQGQPFFTNAKIGDRIIVYSVARKIILWRPSENKIIEIAPINVSAAPEASN